jgi:hypothetical protein
MFMFRRQMGGQVDSKRERAGDSWERGSIVASLHMHSCAHMFMFFSCGQMGGRGNSKRAGVRAIGVGYTRSGEHTVSCGQMDGWGNRERAGAHAISVSGAGFRSQHTFARACE